MSIRNRELSQFGSFIYIEDSTKSVGIATTATPYVGFGTTSAAEKLHVVGNLRVDGSTNVGGAVSATSFYLNGSPLVDAAIDRWSQGSGSDIYRLDGNVGIGTSVTTEKLTVLGNVSSNQFISTVTTGTAPLVVSSQTLVTNLNSDYLRGKTPPSGNLVGDSDNQTLTTKTINLSNNTLSGNLAQFSASLSDDDFVGVSSMQTLTNKTLTSPIITSIRTGIGSTQTVPSGNGTLVSTSSVGIITTGMISDGTITGDDIAVGAGITYGKLSLSNSIVNADIAVGAAITNGKLANSTISGISLGSNLNDLTAGSFVNFDSGSTFNGSAARTISVNATPSNTSSTVVSRDSSGGFNAGSLSVTSGGLIVSGIATIGLGTTSSPANSQMTFDLTSNTNLKLNVKGSDGVLRSVNLTLSPDGTLAASDELGLFW